MVAISIDYCIGVQIIFSYDHSFRSSEENTLLYLSVEVYDNEIKHITYSSSCSPLNNRLRNRK